MFSHNISVGNVTELFVTDHQGLKEICHTSIINSLGIYEYIRSFIKSGALTDILD